MLISLRAFDLPHRPAAAERRRGQAGAGLVSREGGGSKAAGYHVEPLGERLPLRGNRLTRALGRTLLRGVGWRLEGALPNREKVLVIGAPHTTAWDFPIAMVAILALGLRFSWLGADWVLRFPFTRALGGIPVDRSVQQGMVPQTIERFRERPQLVLGLAPEGTRKKVVRWKTGFYHIAVGAGVPVLLVAIDQQRKLISIGPSFEPSGDYEADMEEKIRPFYAEYLDRYPDRFGIQ